MAVDYLSALNVGSGLNVTQIVDALIDAERVPRETQINKRIDERNVSISALGEVKTEVKTFKDNLEFLETTNTNGLVVGSSDEAVGIEANGKIAVQPFTHSFEVTQLATKHTLAFSGFADTTSTTGVTDLTIDFGSWAAGPTFTPRSGNTTVNLSIPAGTDSLADLSNIINNADIGISANVIRVGDGNFALTLVGEEGEENQIRITAENTGVRVDALSYDPETNSADSSNQIIAGTDAEMYIDGVFVSRDSNTVDDLINGVSISLNKVSTNVATVSAQYDKSVAQETLRLFVEEMNFMLEKLNEVTYRGTAGSDDAGPLAGDPLMRSYLNTLKSMTVKPIKGFQSDPVYLSNFGVMTERDGTLSINAARFEEFFTAKPDAFAALLDSRAITDSNLVQAELTGNLWEPGVYTYTNATHNLLDPAPEPPPADQTRLDRPMSLENGKYKITAGGARGLALTLLGNGEDAQVFIGKSLLQTLTEFSEDILKTNGDIDTKIATYNDDIDDFNDRLDELSARMDTERARYVERFTAMEASVTSFKKTGDMLDSFMETWKAGLKG
jgi:flagellar hook-associated protein 2